MSVESAPMRTAAYARFSSDLQRDTSLEDQIRSCREYAERQGWTWQDSQIFTDAALTGATIDGRTGLHALLTAAASQPRPFDVLLVDDSSRVARDLADALRVLQRLRFAGVRVIYISQSIDSASEQAETLVAVHGLVDGLYLREMAQKIRRGLVGQMERGFSTGGVHFGYRSVPLLDPDGGRDQHGYPVRLGTKLEVHEHEAAVIRRIFELYASGIGVPTLIDTLTREGIRGVRGATWKAGAVRRLLANERYMGRQLFGKMKHERVPGTKQKVPRPRPRAEWRIIERPELRIISDELWAAVQARRAQVADVGRQHGRTLMRGRNAALYSRHLFSGFLRCGVCGGAVTIVTGGYGSPRYGCQRRSVNGALSCTNRLTIRAKVADPALLAGLRAELLKPETVRYISDQLAGALNAVRDQRPRQRAALERAKSDAEQKLRNLVAAVENGVGTATIYDAIKDREGELRGLDAEREALNEPLEHRLAVIPTWVRQQLEDAAGLLGGAPERAKTEFQRLGIKFTLHPVTEPGARPFLRAEGTGQLEDLAFREYTNLPNRDGSDLRSES